MGIWIRTQDKKELHLIQSFKIANNSINGLTPCGVQYKLGEYETAERALEVLDEIQSTAIEGNPPKGNENLFYNTCKVFIMPEK